MNKPLALLMCLPAAAFAGEALHAAPEPAGAVSPTLTVGQPFQPEGLNRDDCAVRTLCGGLAEVVCPAVPDTPRYYIEAATGKTVTACGGGPVRAGSAEHRHRQRECPPRGWTCGAPE